ncbi:rhodanese-like domain-containing protein [Flavobacteriaceae bacterium F08102]|nr:rhodanese-like domain-containing protein [Flavobacteriaceae bacterium F08102]
MKKIILLLITFFCLGIEANAQENERITLLDVATFKDSTQYKNVQLVDVRTAKEFNAGNIKGSVNIDYYQQDTFKTSVEKLDKSKPVYLYCRSGGRSHKAAVQLEKLGFTKIYDLKGGYLGWK